MDRRRFNSLCTGLMAGAAGLHANASQQTTVYPKTRLHYQDDAPVTLASLAPGKAYIFSYPYRTTPCFLVRLNSSVPGGASWPGGLGTDQSVVAFSAICSHKMSHPAKPISHISYREAPVTFYDSTGTKQTQGSVISCCSERSVYDAAKGAEVLSGPASVPLAAIALESNENGHLLAVGSIGSDQYERFLDKFGFRLAMEYGVTDVRARSGEKTEITLAEEFSQQQVLC